MSDPIELLRQHNAWRRGNDTRSMADPKLLGEAIDRTIVEVERLRALLRECEPFVTAAAQAEHLLDGFRRQRRQYDDLAERVQAVAK